MWSLGRALAQLWGAGRREGRAVGRPVGPPSSQALTGGGTCPFPSSAPQTELQGPGMQSSLPCFLTQTEGPALAPGTLPDTRACARARAHTHVRGAGWQGSALPAGLSELFPHLSPLPVSSRAPCPPCGPARGWASYSLPRCCQGPQPPVLFPGLFVPWKEAQERRGTNGGAAA